MNHTAGNQLLEKYLSECPEIDTAANYWFFRTDGGALFQPFITSQSIAIGYPTIDLKTLLALPNNKEGKKALRKQIVKSVPTEERPGLAASQLMVFMHVMKPGDFVIIPSEGSHQLAIGKIVAKPPFESRLVYERKEYSGFQKQRKIEWLKTVQRSAINPNLYRILQAHQTVTNVTPWAPWIDTLLFDFFRKGEKYHYVAEINQPGAVNARDLFQTWVDIFKLAEDYLDTLGIDEDASGVDTRINLNSPGDVELITQSVHFVMVVGALVVTLAGGGLKFNLKKFDLSFDLSTDGLIKSISKFLTDHKNRKLADILNKKVEALQLDKSRDIINMIEQANKRKP